MIWIDKNGALEKEFILNSFSEIILKLQVLALIADKLNHHPDFTVKDYNKIIFHLKTHDQGNSVTEKDIQLSKEIDNLFK